MRRQRSAVVGDGVDHRREQVDLAFLGVGVGAVEVEHETLGVGPRGELAEVATSRRFQGGEPVAAALGGGRLDEPVVAVVGIEHVGDRRPVGDRAVAGDDVVGANDASHSSDRRAPSPTPSTRAGSAR